MIGRSTLTVEFLMISIDQPNSPTIWRFVNVGMWGWDQVWTAMSRSSSSNARRNNAGFCLMLEPIIKWVVRVLVCVRKS